jgi:hypothetical protein
LIKQIQSLGIPEDVMKSEKTKAKLFPGRMKFVLSFKRRFDQMALAYPKNTLTYYRKFPISQTSNSYNCPKNTAKRGFGNNIPFLKHSCSIKFTLTGGKR